MGAEAAQPKEGGAHRLRLLVAGALGAGLVWAIVTSSLVTAFFESRPQWALAIEPDDPAALMALAERAMMLVARRLGRTLDVAARPASPVRDASMSFISARYLPSNAAEEAPGS